MFLKTKKCLLSLERSLPEDVCVDAIRMSSGHFQCFSLQPAPLRSSSIVSTTQIQSAQLTVRLIHVPFLSCTSTARVLLVLPETILNASESEKQFFPCCL